MTLFLESPCSHDRTGECDRPICQACNGPYYHESGCQYADRDSQGTIPCPGGSRTELHVDYEAALKAWEGMHGSKGQSPKPSKVLTSIIINTALGLTEGDTR